MSSLYQLLAQLFCLLFVKPFLKVSALPQPLPALQNKRCVFILPKSYVADEMAMKACLADLGLVDSQVICLPGNKRKQVKDKVAQQFVDHLSLLYQQQPDTVFIPVSVFWGRSPRKVKTVLQAYLANSWAVPGKLKRALMVLLQVRQVCCYFGQALALESQLASSTGVKTERYRGLADLLNQQFVKQKETVVGPDLSHQRMLMEYVLNSPAVTDCIANLQQAEGVDKTKLVKRAEKYLREMASDYSHPVVRVFDLFLTWVWEKLYQGVEVRGMENVLAVAEDHELVYVPCHRSHIDYLLLSYVIYHKGLMPPHIAAGINLNLPVVGGLLRRGGAFFIRRQFRDNKLYRAVLESYVTIMCQQGFSIEYFIEGGRSRTGFLLPPKPGMLAMTLRAAQDQRERPLAFLPVYIGYERLLESHSYINELYGEKKQKESLLSLLSARHYLKEDYGKVYMSIGKPIFSDEVWAEQGVTTSPKPDAGPEFFQCVDRLGQTINTRVNSSAFLSPLNYMATALLSSKRKALVEQQLVLQMQLLDKLAASLPGYADSLHREVLQPQAAIEHALALNVVKRNAHTLGDIYYLDQQAQVGATFLRNNSLHVFILPALVASIFINVQHASAKRLTAICLRLYPYLQSEFFLPWQREELAAVIQTIVDAFMAVGLIHYDANEYHSAQAETEQYHALMVLSGACKGSAERFYITAQLVSVAEAGSYDRKTLEQACTQMAERLSLLHEFHAPDFFDKNLFRMFIDRLIKEGLLIEDEEGRLSSHRLFIRARKLAHYVLSPSVKRSIKQITQS